jgi:hypothetical protein
MFDRLRTPRRMSKTQEMISAGRWNGKDPRNVEKLIENLDKI